MKQLACALTLLSAATAAAQPAPTSTPPQSTLSSAAAPPLPEEAKQDKPKEPEAGDFNAGAQARFPSGPDETGEFAMFNWVAVDLQGRYYLLEHVTLDLNVPLAVKRPDTVGPMGPEPSLFGGLTLTLDARISAPKMPGVKYDTTVGLALTAGYMKQGAMLLSSKDYPLFAGDLEFKPGFGVGLVTKVRLSSLLDFSLVPTWVFQAGEPESLTAIQIPVALEIKLDRIAKLNAELGVFSGDGYGFSAGNGGRIYTGASLDLELGPILLHAGAGVASLLTDDSPGAAYPTIRDSLYVDVNVKYAN